MQRIEHLKLIKEEMDREEFAIESFSKKLIHETLNPENRYEIKELISEGGFKKVYRAFDKKTSRDIAYAIIPSNHDVSLQKRIIREAQITAILDHPNITPLYDVGQDKEGLYFTMKLMEGHKMSSLISSSSQNAKEHFNKMLSHVIDVCKALSYAHSKGVFHLDIKPSNIHIGDYGETYLFDWGIAKVDNTNHENLSKYIINSEEIALGTPGCMSPEQHSGQFEKLSQQTDIFLIGSLIYSIYTCKRLNEGEGQSSFQGHDHLNQRDLYGNKLPKSIKLIIKKATQYRQGDRYITIDQVQADLEKYIQNLPTSVDQHKTLKLITAKILQHPFICLTIIIFIISGLVLNNIYTNQINAEQEKTIQKIMPFANMREREILKFYDNKNAENMAETLIETKPESADAWVLKGLLQASRLNFKEADQTFDHVLTLNNLVPYRILTFIRLADKIKNVTNDPPRDFDNPEPILNYLKVLNEPHFNGLVSRNFYSINNQDLNKCIYYFDRALKILNPNENILSTYNNHDEGLEVILKSDGGKLDVSSFMGMPYTKLKVINLDKIYLPYTISDTLKELDLSESKDGNLFFIQDMNLKKLNISNLKITKEYYHTMQNMNTLVADYVTFDKYLSWKHLLGPCFNLEHLSAIGAESRVLLQSIIHLKKLKRLRVTAKQKDFLQKNLPSPIPFQFIDQDTPL